MQGNFSGLKYWQKNTRLNNGLVISSDRGNYNPPEPFDVLEWDQVGDV